MSAETIAGTVIMGALIIVTIVMVPQTWNHNKPYRRRLNSERFIRDPEYTHTTGGRKKYTRRV